MLQLAGLGVEGLVEMVHRFRSELLEAEFEILELSRQVSYRSLIHPITFGSSDPLPLLISICPART